MMDDDDFDYDGYGDGINNNKHGNGINNNKVSGGTGNGGKKRRVCSNTCISKYIASLKEMDLFNDRGNMDFEEWERVLCHTTSRFSTSTPEPPPSNLVNHNKTLIIGVGPGTTASRSVSLAINMFHRSVLHYKVYRDANGERIGSWNSTGDKYHVDMLVDGMINPTTYRYITENSDEIFGTLFDDVDAIFDWPYPMYTLEILRVYPNAKLLMTHRNPHIWYQKRRDFCKGPSHHRMCAVPFVMRPLGLSVRDSSSITDTQAVRSFYATEQLFKCMTDAGNHPDRYLQVDMWSPPPTVLPLSSRMSTIKSFASTKNMTDEEGHDNDDHDKDDDTSTNSATTNSTFTDDDDNDDADADVDNDDVDVYPADDWLPYLTQFLNVSLPPRYESHCSVPKYTGHLLDCKSDDKSCRKCRTYLQKHKPTI